MEEFIGSQLTKAEMDVRGLRVDPNHREGEAALMGSRWFDYRGLHAVAATYLYAHCYKLQTQKFYEQNIDARTVEDARSFFPDDIFMSRDLTSMWLARRAADSMGMPYPFILQFAQERFINRLQRNFPRPNQLYGEEIEADCKEAWLSRIATQLTYSKQPRYRAAEWKRTIEQALHLKFIIDQIQRRPVQSRHRLIGRLFSEGVLAPWMVRGTFDGAAVSSAEEYALTLL